jgi:hypothetical protein
LVDPKSVGPAASAVPLAVASPTEKVLKEPATELVRSDSTVGKVKRSLWPPCQWYSALTAAVVCTVASLIVTY